MPWGMNSQGLGVKLKRQQLWGSAQPAPLCRCLPLWAELLAPCTAEKGSGIAKGNKVPWRHSVPLRSPCSNSCGVAHAVLCLSGRAGRQWVTDGLF